MLLKLDSIIVWKVTILYNNLVSKKILNNKCGSGFWSKTMGSVMRSIHVLDPNVCSNFVTILEYPDEMFRRILIQIHATTGFGYINCIKIKLYIWILSYKIYTDQGPNQISCWKYFIISIFRSFFPFPPLFTLSLLYFFFIRRGWRTRVSHEIPDIVAPKIWCRYR